MTSRAMEFADRHEGLAIAAVICTVVVAIVLVIALSIRQVGHHYDAVKCDRFGVESHREVRFVDYSFWQWQCLTPTSDGKWLPTDQLREIDG